MREFPVVDLMREAESRGQPLQECFLDAHTAGLIVNSAPGLCCPEAVRAFAEDTVHFMFPCQREMGDAAQLMLLTNCMMH